MSKPQRARSTSVSPTLQILLVFATGLAVGALLGSWPHAGQAPALPDARLRTSAIRQVAGRDPTSAPTEASPDPAAPRTAEQRKPRAVPSDPPGAAAPPARLSAAELARRALDFSVFVRAGRTYGAGVLVDHKGHVLTCWHVIEGMEPLRVSFSDGSAYDAVLVDSDRELDLALLRIDRQTDPQLTPASITSVQPGDDVYALGAPRKLAFSLGRGMASFVGRPFANAYFLQTDLAMNAGSSGGPVMNDRGEVIAISSFVLRDSEGIAFALPIDYAYRRFRDAIARPRALEGNAQAAFEGWLANLDRSALEVSQSDRP
jgi:S1-C subfamily serine protease